MSRPACVSRGVYGARGGRLADDPRAVAFIGYAVIPYGFDTIGHLGPIYLATAIFVVGAALALKALLESGRP